MTPETHSAALLKWPEKPEHADRMRGIAVGDMVFPEAQKLLVLMYYEQARAEAYKCRLELAVEALQYVRANIPMVLDGFSTDSAKEAAGILHARAFNALHAIGDLP